SFKACLFLWFQRFWVPFRLHNFPLILSSKEQLWRTIEPSRESAKMSDGFLPFKGLAWGAAALAVGAAVMPSASSFSFDALRTSIQTEPGRLKKRTSYTPTPTPTPTTTTTGTTTTTTTTTTTSGYPELT